MKRTTLTLLCGLFISLTYAQTITGTLDEMKASLQTVEAEKETFVQQIEQDAENPCKLKVTIEITDHKGRTESEAYEFYWSDLEEHAVRYEAKRDVIRVPFHASNGRPLIKYFEDGAFDGYQEEGRLIASDSENAKQLVELLKEGIALCAQRPNPDAPPEVYDALLEWLNEKVVLANFGDERYEQMFLAEDGDPNRLQLEQTEIDDKNRESFALYKFHPADLNDRKIEFEIRRNQIEITIQTKGERDLIAEYEDGEYDGLTDEYTLYLDDVDVARSIIPAIERLISLGRERLEASLPDVSTLEKAAEVLNAQIGNINRDEVSQEQKFELGADCWVEYSRQAEDEMHDFYFYSGAINPSSLQLDISGKKDIDIELETEEMKLIRHMENGELQNYDDEVSLLFGTIENARVALHALEAAVAQCRELEIPVHDLDWLIANTSEVTVEEETFTQELKRRDGDCSLEYRLRGPDDEYIYEFLLVDLDPLAVEIDVSGNELFIQLHTRGGEQLIKTFENGQPDDYEDEIEIRIPDPKTALIARESWKNVLEGCQ